MNQRNAEMRKIIVDLENEIKIINGKLDKLKDLLTQDDTVEPTETKQMESVTDLSSFLLNENDLIEIRKKEKLMKQEKSLDYTKIRDELFNEKK